MVKSYSTTEEFLAQKGKTIGISDWIDVSQEMIYLYAAATGDHQWIHTDVAKAKASPLGSTIAHGLLILSLGSKSCMEIIKIDSASFVINYGLNKVRFLCPVVPGSKIRSKIQLSEFSRIDRKKTNKKQRNFCGAAKKS